VNGPPDVVAFECVCRHVPATHCQPTRMRRASANRSPITLEHHLNDSRWLAQRVALGLLEVEHPLWFTGCQFRIGPTGDGIMVT